MNTLNLVAAGSIVCLAMLAETASAWAQNVIDVPRGRTSIIYNIGVHNESCGSAPLAKMGRMHAQNGTLSTRNGSARISDGVCKGRSINVVQVLYKPNAGFSGRDSVVLDWSFPTYLHNPARRTGKSRRLVVNVR